MSGHGTVDTAVEATRLGAFDFVEKPLSLAKLLRTVEAALAAADKQLRAGHASIALTAGAGRPQQGDAGLRERVAQYAQHDALVLITGEPGSWSRCIRALPARAK